MRKQIGRAWWEGWGVYVIPRAFRAKRASGSCLSCLICLPYFLQKGKICVTAPDISRQGQARTLVASTVTFYQRIFSSPYMRLNISRLIMAQETYTFPPTKHYPFKKKKRQFNFKHHFLKIALISKVLFQFQVLLGWASKSLVHCP